jgi:DNA ligase-1
VIAFGRLLDALLFSPARTTKTRLIARHLAETPDPDRGWALAALTGDLDLAAVKPAQVRVLVGERVDPVLFQLSYDFVGDLAETVALIWPARPGANAPPDLATVVDRLRSAARADGPRLLASWLDGLDATGRWALLKLVTGGLRVGVSAALAKAAVAEWAGRPASEIEELWHGLRPPYGELFAWAEGRAPRPDPGSQPVFRAPMLAHPLEEDDLARLDPRDFQVEWKWDGVRVQLVGRADGRRLYSRAGEDLTSAFPDVVGAGPIDAVVDGELLVGRWVDGDWRPATFAELQKRLNRKAPGARLMAASPAFVRLYDLLFDGPEDLRPLPLTERRRRLEAWHARTRHRRLDLSPILPSPSDWDELRALRDGARDGDPAIEGLMLKRADAPYLAGRPKGLWWKWKRAALTLDCVLMYAQRGHGKRSSFYSDYTFGCWSDDRLVPVGKAYSGFTDAELVRIDKWVRDNTVDRHGPVRVVAPGLVLEVAFDAVRRSTRHRSGLAMRFPRISRVRWDKPFAEADRVETLERMIGIDESQH